MNKIEFSGILSGVNDFASQVFKQEMDMLYPGQVHPSISFSICTLEHVERTESWPDTSAQKNGYGWSWEEIYHKSKYSPAKFMIAVTCNGVEGGMFSGKLLASEIELQYVQRNARCGSLKGFMIPASVTYTAILGQVMGRETLTICEPATDIVDHYSRSMKGHVKLTHNAKDEVVRMSVAVDEVVSPSTNQ